MFSIVVDHGFTYKQEDPLANHPPPTPTEIILFSEIDQMVVRVEKYLQQLGRKMKGLVERISAERNKEFKSVFMGRNLVGFQLNVGTQELTLLWKYRPNHVMAHVAIENHPDSSNQFELEADPQETRVVVSPEYEPTRLELLSLVGDKPAGIERTIEQYCQKQLSFMNLKDEPAKPYKNTHVFVKDIRFFECNYVEWTLRTILLQGISEMGFYDMEDKSEIIKLV
jgi:hypothetical protein